MHNNELSNSLGIESTHVNRWIISISPGLIFLLPSGERQWNTTHRIIVRKKEDGLTLSLELGSIMSVGSSSKSLPSLQRMRSSAQQVSHHSVVGISKAERSPSIFAFSLPIQSVVLSYPNTWTHSAVSTSPSASFLTLEHRSLADIFIAVP